MSTKPSQMNITNQQPVKMGTKPVPDALPRLGQLLGGPAPTKPTDR